MPYVHHVAIHFPIALAMLAALGSILAWMRGDWFRDARRLISYLVTLSALVAVTSGLLSASHVAGEIEESQVARHRNIALAAASISLLTALLGFVGARKRSNALVKTSEVGSIVTAAVVGLAGHFGGDMLHPGLTPWSTEPHSHGMKQEHAAGTGADEHERMMMMATPDAADSMAMADVTEPNTSSEAGSMDARGHAHSHGLIVDPSAGTMTATPTPTTTPTPTPTPTPTATIPPPPMTGMPSGHKM